MVVIRLSRAGAKKRPFYHVVVVDSQRRRDAGNYVERVGYYNPVARGQEVPIHLAMDRIQHWIGEGAQISDRVRSLLKKVQKTADAA